MLRKYVIYLAMFAMASVQSCAAHKVTMGEGAFWLGKALQTNEHLEHHDVGLAVYDPADGRWIFQRNADKYYTPASNTKILTLYTAMHYLQDSTEALRYALLGDTLIFWGTGDPSFLFKDWKSEAVIELLASHEGPVQYAPLPEIQKFGAGWAWDDYKYGFQVEKSTMPVFGNRVTFSRASVAEDGRVTPEYFKQFIIDDPSQGIFVERLPDANSFEINPAKMGALPFEKEIPFVVTSYDIAAILSEVTGRNIELNYRFSEREDYYSIHGVPVDSLNKRMMQASDNFIAEQLILLCASRIDDEYGTSDIIKIAQKDLFADVEDQFQWFDGSGLSRYNLFTPRSLIFVLNRILELKDMTYVKEIFAAGGESGTMENWYAGPEGPYVFAKTGTLRNHHCLSGYLVAKSGKTLIFSFMNQNYIGSSEHVKQGMQSILMSIYEKY